MLAHSRWFLVVVCLWFFVLAGSADAQDQPRRWVLIEPGRKTEVEKAYPHSYALLIGINKYRHVSDRDLHYAVADVDELKRELIAHYGFPGKNVTVLTDAQATKQGILEALSAFTDTHKIKPEDRVLIFFSGHGQTMSLPNSDSRQMGYLIPSDAQIDLGDSTNLAPYNATCIKMREVWDTLDGCPARHVLLIADACYSGLMAAPRALKGMSPATLAAWLAEPARMVMAAGGKGEESQEDPSWGHGAFTKALLEQLHKRSADPGVVFTSTELFADLQGEVKDLTEGKQTPQLGKHEAEGEFLFITTDSAKPDPVRPSVDVSPLIEAAVRLLMRSNSTHDAEVMQKVRQAIASDPRNASAHAVLSWALSRLNLNETAEQEAHRALELDSSNALAHFAIARVDNIQNRYDDAIVEYKQAIKIDPTIAAPHNNLGAIYAGRKHYGEAIAEYKQAIELDPNWASPHHNLGAIYVDQKRNSEAIAEYKQAIELDPLDAGSHSGLGAVYNSQKRYDDAISEYKQAIELDPKSAAIHNSLGNVYDNQNRFDEAISEYQQAIKLDPKYAYPHNGLGIVNYARKRFDEAISEYKQAVELDPKFSSPHYGLGNVYNSQKRYNEAISEFKQAIELDPKSAAIHNSLGNVYTVQTRYDDAISEYKQAIELDPKDAYLHMRLGYVYLRRRRCDEAISEFDEALHIDPNFELARRLRAIAVKAKNL